MNTPTPLPWPTLGSTTPTRQLPAPPAFENLIQLAATATPLSRWFLAPAGADVLENLHAENLPHTWPLPPTDASSQAALHDLAGPHDVDAVAADHQRLFVGPGHMEAAPYESVHTSAEGLLFEPETLDVRAWYQHYGLSAPRQGKEPDDHIGLELEFLATLATWASDCLEEDDTQSAAIYAQGARQFTATHLLPWAPDFCALVRARAHTTFYQAVAAATAALLDAAPALLKPNGPL
ncbi:Twin-arginine leader-binding protein DmsD [Dermatophilus congolensis]|uniref:Twin-arginine leader-binding protein DmsD n=1 Tax=Dermatophilus congolensis TaxID=1863 RepID=A0AA46H107_9MICO|nr:molecular chaperone TorD family protein [Dermatophilus congolensis]STD12262.1 Twin-arginine leader-binding protein DmsD [Dermatophilus congolensis]